MNIPYLSLKKYFLYFSVLLSASAVVSCKKDKPVSPATGKVDVVYMGGEDKNLYALNAQSGALVWKYQSAGNFAYSTPALVNNVLYSTNTDHNLYALDATSGKLKWTFATQSTVISSPAIANGIAYFGSDDHYIYAVDAQTGTLKWKYQTLGNVDSSPVVANGILYIGSTDGNLYAIDAANGSLKWKYDTGSVIVQSSPVISNDVVLIGSRNGFLTAVNTATGQKKWSFNADNVSMEQATPVVNNGVIYFASWYKIGDISTPGSLYAIKESDGSQIWKSLDDQGFSSGPAYANGRLFINSDDGNVYAVDAITGKVIWKRLIYANGSIPAIANGNVFAGGGGSNFFYVLDADSGGDSWKFPLNSIDTSKPLVVLAK
jgi:outer membrane protein assembly factor BamB